MCCFRAVQHLSGAHVLSVLFSSVIAESLDKKSIPPFNVSCYLELVFHTESNTMHELQAIRPGILFKYSYMITPTYRGTACQRVLFSAGIT